LRLLQTRFSVINLPDLTAPNRTNNYHFKKYRPFFSARVTQKLAPFTHIHTKTGSNNALFMGWHNHCKGTNSKRVLKSLHQCKTFLTGSGSSLLLLFFWMMFHEPINDKIFGFFQ